jgi:Flp pilus assembly protein TadD
MKKPNIKATNDPPAEQTPPAASNGFFEGLVSILPSIRLPIQLLGLVITIVGYLIVRVVSPDNVPAMLSAGTVGVGLIIFATLFLIVPMIQKSQRALFILVLFIVYIAASIYLVKITYELIESGARQVTEESLKAVGASLAAREQDLSNQVAKAQRQLDDLIVRKNRSASAIETDEIDNAISEKKLEEANLEKLLAGVRARQQSLQDTHLLIGNVVAELNRIEQENALKPQSPGAPKIAIAAADAARGDFDEAQRVYEQRLRDKKQDVGRVNLVLGEIAEVRGNLSEALDYYKAADQILATDPIAAEYHARLCRLLGDFEESKTTYKHALDLVGTTPPDQRQWLLTNYAVSLWHLGDTAEARKNFAAAYDSSAPLTLSRALVAQSFGSFLWDLDELTPAEAKLREADQIYSQLEVTKQFLRYETLNDLGGVLLAKGQYEESRNYLEASLSMIADKVGVRNLAYAQTAANLVENRSRFGDLSNADGYVKFLLKRESDGGFAGYELGAILGAVAEYFNEKLEIDQTEEVLKRAFGILSRTQAKGAAETILAKVAMKQIEALLDAGLIELANSEFIKNADFLGAAVKPNTRSEIQLERTKGRLSLARQQWNDAISHLQRSITIAHQTIGSDHPNLVWSLAPLAKSYLGAQKDSETSATLQEAKRIASKWLSPNSRIWSQLNDIASLVGSPHPESIKSDKT